MPITSGGVPGTGILTPSQWQNPPPPHQHPEPAKSPEAGKTQSRKRKKGGSPTKAPAKESTGQGRGKRQKNVAPPAEASEQVGAGTSVPRATATQPLTAAVCDVGPSSEPTLGQATGTVLESSSSSSGANTCGARTNATDVWYFLLPVNTKGQPEEMPSDNQPHLMHKPDSPFIVCRLCW